ncbi:hypothetical protein CYMTET_10860 [Cymbomonas tetramitiformis]|uniref:Uncharacterized protein n=1 Tax=Cymbomonas tetramitiformis TaxID=36881 RepID=A0AAE0LE12_9CHLO|nr:hypothetical protein CYMTET_10860 [Cymbomonas tetramitiformis]
MRPGRHSLTTKSTRSFGSRTYEYELEEKLEFRFGCHVGIVFNLSVRVLQILGSINRCHTRDVIISLIDGSNNPRTAEYKVNTKNNADLIARDDGSCLRSWNR